MHAASLRCRLGTALLTIATAGCTPPPDDFEVVYSLHPPTWFEDGWSYYEVAGNGTAALFGARFGFRLIDLTNGQEDPERYSAGMAQVSSATFATGNRLARRGRMDDTAGWYVEAAGDPERLALPAAARPRWSADGARVAYYIPGENALFMGPPGDVTRYDLGGVVTGVNWDPSGEVVYALGHHADGVSTLFRAAVASGAVAPIRENLDATARFNSIGVAPDGASLYLALAGAGVPDPMDRHRPQAGRHMDIYKLNVATGELLPAVTTPGDDFYPMVVGDTLYWTHTEMRDDIVVVPVEGGDARVVVEDAQIPYWRHDGAQLAFTYGAWSVANWALNLDAGVVDVDADARAVSEPRPVVVGIHEDFTPAWSPDGRWIAYHSHRAAEPVASYGAEGATDDIYIKRPDAPMDEEIRLTDFGWEVGMADWSPDGTRLVFDSWERGGPPGVSRPWIATIDPDDGTLVRLERLPLPDGVESSLLAAWSPRGDEIAMVERVGGERMALWILSLEGRAPVRRHVYRTSTYGGVDWTPDGETLVYGALSGDGRMQLFAVPRAEGVPRQLTDDDANLAHPQVSPDGRWIAATRMWRVKELRSRVLR